MLNIHPAIVHTPIGLLTLYALLEFLRFKKLLTKPYWFYIKAVLAIVGFFGTLAALFSGGLIEDAFPEDKLVEMHSNFGVITAVVAGIIAGSYMILWFEKEFGDAAFLKKGIMAKIWNLKLKTARLLQTGWVIMLLAAVVLVCVFITGALGGAIVYGPEVDPMVAFIYHLFF